MSKQEQNSPGIRLIPPLVYAVSLLIGLAVEQLLPLVSLSWLWRIGPSIVLIGLSCLLVLPAVVRFRRALTLPPKTGPS